MDQLQEFVYILRPKRDDFFANITPKEKMIMDLHLEYCNNMLNKGTYIISDVSLNGVYGICVFMAESPEAALQIFNNDPAINAGLLSAELHRGINSYFPNSRDETTLLYSYHD